ncbi:MAG TPA: class I adenylate-forming enzyme family protein [Acidimicrobiales bacterium]|nr:class I adenylate-forming enzyme family protein [Acidimicrobiales bacterium]
MNLPDGASGAGRAGVQLRAGAGGQRTAHQLDGAWWRDDGAPDLDARPVGRVLEDLARRRGDHPALLWESGGSIRSLSYAELCEGSTELAVRLARWAGRAPVAVAAAASIDWLTLEYASALSGTPLVPVNPALTDEEIAHILHASGARRVLADEAYRGAPLLGRLPGAHPLGAWRDLPSGTAELPTVGTDDAFLVQFTSGTTGRPKGAVLSHRAAYNCARVSFAAMGGRSDDIWLNVMPMHHVGGSVSVALAVLSAGATLVVVPAFEPGAVLGLLERTRATIIGTVPTMQLALLEHPRFPATDLGALRIVQSGGSVVPAALIRRAEESFGAVVVNAYGQSESPNAIQTSPADDDRTKAETIGRPNPRRDVRIVRADGTTAAFREAGELWMRSPLVMDRYVGVAPEVAAQTLGADGWLRTGDVCSMDERGVVTVHGRLRDVIIRGGENIYPAEVEGVLMRHPAVADVAVVAVADDRWGEVPVACYRPGPDGPADEKELEQFAREHLASFKVPRRWVVMATLPLTASGKVKKHDLRSMLESPGGERGPEAVDELGV